MNVLIAIDSFKGSMTSLEAGNAAAKGVLAACPDAKIKVMPIADGGEGTMDALTAGMGGRIVETVVTGPTGEKLTAKYGMLDNGTAVIEMAQAAGLPLVPRELRNPMHTTTYGVGEQIADAIKKGCRRFIVGIGGSATNDCGTGMLRALGYEITDKDGNDIPFGAEGCLKAAKIGTEKVLPELSECSFLVACDVDNPLCGSRGASAVYGPQKGADPEMVKVMDGALDSFAKLAKTVNPEADPDIPGSGAAGGMGFAFRTFLSAELKSGIGIVLEETGIDREAEWADLVITGEGRLDGQTANGKAPAGVAAAAKKYNKPVLAFSGCLGKEAEKVNSCGIDAFFPILREVVTLEKAMESGYAAGNMQKTVEQAVRLFQIRN